MRKTIDYVMYPWWPVDGNDWVHPEDVALARQLIPSRRIFRFGQQQGDYYVLTYGPLTLRVRPALWLPLRGEGLNVGDAVEVLSRMGRRRPGLGTICDMLWNPYRGRIEYKIERRGIPLARSFFADDLRHVDPPRHEEEVEIPATAEGDPLQVQDAE